MSDVDGQWCFCRICATDVDHPALDDDERRVVGDVQDGWTAPPTIRGMPKQVKRLACGFRNHNNYSVIQAYLAGRSRRSP